MFELLVFIYIFVGIVVFKENYGMCEKFWGSLQAAISWPFLFLVLIMFLCVG